MNIVKRFFWRFRRFFLSGKLPWQYLILTVVFFIIAILTFYFKASLRGGEFLWQALLGMSTGLFVGFLVDAIEGWYRIRFSSKILSILRVEETLPIVVANLTPPPNTSASSRQSEIPNNSIVMADKARPYQFTGPGETIAIGLLFGAYTNIFSTASRAISTSNLVVLPSGDDNEKTKNDYTSQRLIFGGPKYNELTRLLLEKREISVHYPKDEQGQYESRLELKDRTKIWQPRPKKGERDFGLVLKLGRQLHISGCCTWGVIGAAMAVFSEEVASKLVQSLEGKGIDPLSNDYFAIITCDVPDWDNHYCIGQVSIEESSIIRSESVGKTG